MTPRFYSRLRQGQQGGMKPTIVFPHFVYVTHLSVSPFKMETNRSLLGLYILYSMWTIKLDRSEVYFLISTSKCNI